MIIFSFLHICQADYVAPVGVVVEHEHAASSTPIETRVAPDGVGYTWAEFESNLDADITAAIWEAAEVVAAPEPTPILTSPRFEPGSIVRVLADTTPGVHPMHAGGMQTNGMVSPPCSLNAICIVVVLIPLTLKRCK